MQAKQHVVPHTTRPWQLYVTVGLLAFVGIGALPAGLAFIVDPSGALLGLPADLLNSPIFPDFLVPGLFLFFVIGIGSLLAAAFLLWRPAWGWPNRLNPFRRQQWHWALAFAVGCTLMIWIVVQLFSITLDSFLQPFIFAIGAAIVMLLLLPGMRGYYAR